MRKDELDRRSAELKARMLGQRKEHAQQTSFNATERKSLGKAKREQDSITVKSSDSGDVNALKERVIQLEAENKSLRQQLARKSSTVAESSRSALDSGREQRHNFFKYSNFRR